MHILSEQGYIQQVSIHCVIFGYQNKQLKVLVPKLIFKGDFWALPSGFVYQDEDIDEAAKRILEDRTGIKDVYLASFKTMGKAGRNSRDFLDRLMELNPNPLDDQVKRREYEWFTRRFIGIGYYALVDLNQVVAQKNEIDASIEWYDINAVPQLIMDHNELVDEALETLRADLDRKHLAFHLLPETFTMKEVQELYETILEKSFAANNFPKRILELNVLERLEKKFTGAANKAPYLYRFPKQNRPPHDTSISANR
ncbi:NUDIX domain-containing protein [Larkinella knui]|uniref:NUDIX domain-containing protein n=1 Tax=Larkinella knui TaxID=2025310 RepID=A0A3P1CNQ3_9BACT|nr:NUDIX domain-containing protein [Larkinella knui]RRB14947.1 NUDIX domain-containing protein [Larkinella knui]